MIYLHSSTKSEISQAGASIYSKQTIERKSILKEFKTSLHRERERDLYFLDCFHGI